MPFPFFPRSPRHRLKEVAREIIDGLRDGSIVPDTPMGRDENERIAVAVNFSCGWCGRHHRREVPVTGGPIDVDCACGGKIRLEVQGQEA